MNLIDKQLEKIKQEKRLGLMTHVVVGYPSLEATESLIRIMEDAGVDFVELQIPFSDPLADGPTIMKACEKALENGIKVKDAFELARRLSNIIKIPLIFMAYYNTVFKYGTRKFCQDAKRVGVSGLIIPDIPLEEEHQEHFIKYCKEAGLKNIRVVSPASTLERLKKNAEVADGFVYCTARQGITGVQKELDLKIGTFLKNTKKYFSIPVAVGFGISNKERAGMIKPFADIAIIGSAIIDVINNSKKDELEMAIKNFIQKLTSNAKKVKEVI
ncbi:tryptophan synthase subunit alpha [Candidatus Roizmanbacteria bacterium]|nr:tryptophan synthase subunit alpha [Candidatus Roizmanbacteria bacterium]